MWQIWNLILNLPHLIYPAGYGMELPVMSENPPPGQPKPACCRRTDPCGKAEKQNSRKHCPVIGKGGEE